jgi:hypothetical protein
MTLLVLDAKGLLGLSVQPYKQIRLTRGEISREPDQPRSGTQRRKLNIRTLDEEG